MASSTGSNKRRQYKVHNSCFHVVYVEGTSPALIVEFFSHVVDAKSWSGLVGGVYNELQDPHLDNLIFGVPYHFLVPDFDRGGWVGSANISESFVQFLRKRRRGKTQVRDPETLVQDPDTRSFPRKRFKSSQVHLITSDSHAQGTRWVTAD